MAYNMALDLVALALQEARKGNTVNASRLFVGASQHESVDKAMKMIQATNDHALKVAAAAQAAPAKKTQASKAAPQKAVAGYEKTDAATLAVLRKLDAEAVSAAKVHAESDEERHEDDAEHDIEDAEYDEDEAAEEASVKPVNAHAQAKAFAKVLATMQKNAKAAPAKK